MIILHRHNPSSLVHTSQLTPRTIHVKCRRHAHGLTSLATLITDSIVDDAPVHTGRYNMERLVECFGLTFVVGTFTLLLGNLHLCSERHRKKKREDEQHVITR